MILPLILASITAILFGVSKVLIKLAGDVNSFSSVLYTLLVAPPILLCFAAINGDFFKTYNLDLLTIVDLLVAGAFQLAIGRVFAYSSIKLIGASRASQLTSTQIFFAAILSVLLQNEEMTLTIGVGTLAIFCGELLVLMSNPEEKGQKLSKSYSFQKGVAYGLIGGFIWGASQSFAKDGSRRLGSPIMASLFAYIFAIIIQFTITINSAESKTKIPLERAKYLFLSGIASTFGLIAQYTALLIEQVIWVTPIVNTSPLITLFVSYILIPKAELINWRLIIGAIIVVLGVLFITF
ncbi:MAG: DMT family transporter [Candidatus Bathyarchaeia archaeon]